MANPRVPQNPIIALYVCSQDQRNIFLKRWGNTYMPRWRGTRSPWWTSSSDTVWTWWSFSYSNTGGALQSLSCGWRGSCIVVGEPSGIIDRQGGCREWRYMYMGGARRSCFWRTMVWLIATECVTYMYKVKNKNILIKLFVWILRPNLNNFGYLTHFMN